MTRIKVVAEQADRLANAATAQPAAYNDWHISCAFAHAPKPSDPEQARARMLLLAGIGCDQDFWYEVFKP